MDIVGTLESTWPGEDGYFCTKHKQVTTECKQYETEYDGFEFADCDEHTDHEYYVDIEELDALENGLAM